jgi:hypothetical protein
MSAADDSKTRLELDSVLGEQLHEIDQMLAQREIALKSRPFEAARVFADVCIISIGNTHRGEEKPPGSFLEYVDAEWFKILYARTVAWYSLRYGPSMEGGSHHILHGVTLILGTPFRLEVPATTAVPETPGETIWLNFHDKVESEEDVLSWLVKPPNFGTISRSNVAKARHLATEIAGNLRSIYIQLMTVDSGDYRVAELRDIIIPQLQQAADEIARGGLAHLKAAQWPLQMSCELALKMLLQQRTGAFPVTHDLYSLYDQLQQGTVPFHRNLLRQIPNWKRMIGWRYGGENDVRLDQTFARYRAALRIVRGAAISADRKVDLSRAGFLLKRAPFLHTDLNMFRP